MQSKYWVITISLICLSVISFFILSKNARQAPTQRATTPKIFNIDKLSGDPPEERYIDTLVYILNHGEEIDRCKADLILCRLDTIDNKYFDYLVKAVIDGHTFSSRFLAKNGSVKAIKAMIEAVKKEASTASTLNYNFRHLRTKALPYLLELFKCKDSYQNTQILSAVASIFNELDLYSIPAIPSLKHIALSKQYSITARIGAIESIEQISKYANNIDKELYPLIKENPKVFTDPVIRCLSRLKSPLIVDLLLDKLDTTSVAWKKEFLIRDIAEFGSNGYSAGKHLHQYLFHYDFDVRKATALTLGYIGYKPAIPNIINLLFFEPDWRINYVSVQSLEMLQAKEALPALKKLANTHWFSPVRDISKIAIINISESRALPPTLNGYAFYQNFRSYDDAVTALGCFSLKKNEAQMSLPIWNGTLMGTDHGEWGGELFFVSKKGITDTVLNDNIFSINIIKGKVIVIAGGGQLYPGVGQVYVIENIDNKIRYKKILALPGQPTAIAKVKNSGIMIETEGSTVMLTNELKLQEIKFSKFFEVDKYLLGKRWEEYGYKYYNDFDLFHIWM